MVLFAAMAANAVKIAKRRAADPPPERQAA